MLDYGPLIKWGLIVLGVLATFGAIFYAGMKQKQQEWDASIMRQATQSASDVIEQARNTAAAEVHYVQVKGKADVRTKIVEKEVIKYVDAPNAHCQLSPEFEHAFDAVTGLLQPTEDGLPATSGAPGAIPEPTSPPVTDVEVLRAHEALVVQYRDLWLTYGALVQWVRSTYQLQQKEFAQ